MKTKEFKFAQATAHYGEETNITQQLFNEAYNHRVEQGEGIIGSNNVAAIALVFTDGTIITDVGTSNQTRSKTGEDDRNNHAERESLAAVIHKAIHQSKEPFNNQLFARLNKRTIKELISLDALLGRKQLTLEQQEQQKVLLQALSGLSQLVIYSEREFCDFKSPQQEGCKTYLDVLEQKCSNKHFIQGFYSISTGIPNLPAAKMLHFMSCGSIKGLIEAQKYQEVAQKLEQIQAIIFNPANAYWIHSAQNRTLRISTKAENDIAQLDNRIKEILSTPLAPTLAQRFAAVEEEAAAMPSQQSKQDPLESDALEILEEIQSIISNSINEFAKDKKHANTLQLDKSLADMKVSPKIWNEKIQAILKSLSHRKDELKSQLTDDNQKQISEEIDIIQKQASYLNTFCKKNLQFLSNDLQQLSRDQQQQKKLHTEITTLQNKSEKLIEYSASKLANDKLIKQKQEEAGKIYQELKTCKKEIYTKLKTLQQSITDNLGLFQLTTAPPDNGTELLQLLDSVAVQSPEQRKRSAKP